MPIEAGEDFVLFKPAGMSVEVSHSSDEPLRFETLLDWLRGELLRRQVSRGAGANAAADVTLRLPHRLDRMARGIVVVAGSDRAAAFHSRQIAEGRWEKYYLARVRGERDSLQGLIGRHRLHLKREGRRATVVRSGGDRAELEVLAMAGAPGRAGQLHLLIRLLTGRHHQIRVTLEHLGAAVVGDPLYDTAAARTSEPVPPFLCHALLRMPALDGSVEAVLLEKTHFGEAIDPSLLDHITRCATPAAT
mgnify:CR=1 FL=1